MAIIRKRGSKWQAQVRRKGHPFLIRSFTLKSDASQWARELELIVDRGESGETRPKPVKQLSSTLLGLIERYEATVTPTKRSMLSEICHLRQIKRHEISACLVDELTSVHVATFRDDRLRSVSGPTVRKELTLIGTILKLAKAEWGLSLEGSPVDQVKKPPSARSRDRRLEDGELGRLNEALSQCRNSLVREVFLFALATGMRRGEVLSLQWRNVSLVTNTALLPLTKNGDPRTVPLSPAALEVLARRFKCRYEASLSHQRATPEAAGPVFPISANAFRLASERVKKRAGILDLRFHDLRHEAISHFFEIGLTVPEVALISGHKDARMLFRYTHLRAEDVAKKLDSYKGNKYVL